jgi:Aldo/keto reductase family
MSTRRESGDRTGAAAAGTFTLGGDRAVHRLGFGAMRLPEDRRQARALLGRAVELGVRLIDTAEFYGPGTSERLIAEALWPYPDGLVVATKGLTHPPDRWGQPGRPGRLREAVEGILIRLATVGGVMGCRPVSRLPSVQRDTGRACTAVQLVARAAVTIRRVTALGWEIIDTCEALILTIRAPARSAMNSWVAGRITRSTVPTSAQDGMSAQAGGPEGWPRVTVEMGRWVAARTAACLAGRSLAKQDGNRLCLI